MCYPAGVAPSREQGSGAGLRSPQEKGSPSRSRTQPRRPPRGKPPATPLPPGPPPRQAGQELAPGAAKTALGRLPGTARAGRRGKGVSVSVGACFCLPPFGDREGSVQTAWCQSDAEHRAPLLEQSQLFHCSALPSPSRQTRLPQIAGNSVTNSSSDIKQHQFLAYHVASLSSDTYISWDPNQCLATLASSLWARALWSRDWLATRERSSRRELHEQPWLLPEPQVLQHT